MQRDEIRDRVRLLTVLETDDVTDAEINDLIDDGVNVVSARYRWPWAVGTSTITTVDGTQNYDLPTDFSSGIKIVDNDNRNHLTLLSNGEALEMWGGDFPSSSQATHYFIFDDDIYLIPIPNAADTDRYTLYYHTFHTALPNDTASPDWHDTFHHILVDYVLAQLWQREEYFEESFRSRQRFERGLEEMKRFYNRRFPDHPMIWGDGVLRGGLAHPNMPFLDSV